MQLENVEMLMEKKKKRKIKYHNLGKVNLTFQVGMYTIKTIQDA